MDPLDHLDLRVRMANKVPLALLAQLAQLVHQDRPLSNRKPLSMKRHLPTKEPQLTSLLNTESDTINFQMLT